MFVVVTRVPLKPGRIDAVRELFQRTNPGLVAGQTQWVSASFTADRENDEIAVLAYWRDPEAYRTFSDSQRFRETMALFREHFAGPPQVSINEILFEM